MAAGTPAPTSVGLPACTAYLPASKPGRPDVDVASSTSPALREQTSIANRYSSHPAAALQREMPHVNPTGSAVTGARPYGPTTVAGEGIPAGNRSILSELLPRLLCQMARLLSRVTLGRTVMQSELLRRVPGHMAQPTSRAMVHQAQGGHVYHYHRALPASDDSRKRRYYYYVEAPTAGKLHSTSYSRDTDSSAATMTSRMGRCVISLTAQFGTISSITLPRVTIRPV